MGMPMRLRGTCDTQLAMTLAKIWCLRCHLDETYRIGVRVSHRIQNTFGGLASSTLFSQRFGVCQEEPADASAIARVWHQVVRTVYGEGIAKDRSPHRVALGFRLIGGAVGSAGVRAGNLNSVVDLGNTALALHSSQRIATRSSLSASRRIHATLR
jgi:hypothetical protein